VISWPIVENTKTLLSSQVQGFLEDTYCLVSNACLACVKIIILDKQVIVALYFDMQPLVSVITVVYNAQDTIQRAIDSVRRQTYKNLQYIVIDGASSDNTLQIIEDNLDVIKSYVSESDSGIYDAMNKGIKRSEGSYIIMLNSDDWYEDNAIELLVNHIQDTNVDFVGSLARYINPDGTSKVLPSMSFDEATLLRMPLRHQTLLISRNIYEKLGLYDTSFPIIADFDFAIRLYLNGLSYSEVNLPLLNFSTTGVSNTNWEKLHQEHSSLYQKYFPELSTEEADKISNHITAHPRNFSEVCQNHPDLLQLRTASQRLLNEFATVWGGHWETEYEVMPINSREITPLVSIIIPAYNCSDTIEAALGSCLSQDYEHIEVICVDDCSIDSTIDVVKKIAHNDQRVKIVRNQSNSGPGFSRNHGFSESSGELILFMDADDLLLPKSIDHLVTLQLKYCSDIVRGAFKVSRHIFDKYQSSVKFIIDGQDTDEHLLVANARLNALKTTEGHWACIYSRQLIQSNPYPTDLDVGEDSLFLIAAILSAKSVAVTSHCVYEYRDSVNSAMDSYNFKKLLDDLDWRERALNMLSDKYIDKGCFFAFEYWNADLFDNISNILNQDELWEFRSRLDSYINRLGAPRESLIFSIYQKLQPDKFTSKVTHQSIHDNQNSSASTSTKLKILILYSLPTGGAAVAARRMLSEFRNAGHSAYAVSLKADEINHVYQCYFDQKYTELNGQVELDSQQLWSIWHRNSHVESNAREFFSRESSLVDISKLKDTIDSVDVVYLHWHIGLVGINHFPDLFSKTPFVWTFHDMAPMTGGCHYSEGCLSFESSCNDCPLLPLGSKHIAQDTFSLKDKALKSLDTLDIVAPSRWLGEKISKSAIFSDSNVTIIPNFVDNENFYLRNKTLSRLALGLPLDKKIILFGADSLANERKGGSILIRALRILYGQDLLSNVQFVTFGGSMLNLPFASHNLGKISDPNRLGQIFSAADLFAFPSLEENAPQVVIESLLSGTPVVSFPVGFTPELLRDPQVGYLAQLSNESDFAHGIKTILEHQKQLNFEQLWDYRRSIAKSIEHYADNASILSQHIHLLNSKIASKV
jgi:glycosyltransferase involved in cell wall biosynthesis